MVGLQPSKLVAWVRFPPWVLHILSGMLVHSKAGTSAAGTEVSAVLVQLVQVQLFSVENIKKLVIVLVKIALFLVR